MKKRIFTILLAAILSFSLMASIIYAAEPKDDVVYDKFANEKVAFLEMLNKNYIFNEAFVDDVAIIEGAMLSLMPQAKEGRLHKDTIALFIEDFYGITMNENAYDLNYIAGDYYYFIPKGFNKPIHKITNIAFDGECYFVTSNITLDTHDNGEEPYTVKSVFIKNNDSSYKYNLLNCEII